MVDLACIPLADPRTGIIAPATQFKGIQVDVLRPVRYHGTGHTSAAVPERLTVLGISDTDPTRLRIPSEWWLHAATPQAPTAVVVIGHRFISGAPCAWIEPVEFELDGRIIPARYRFAGTYAGSRDSRFRDTVETALGYALCGALKVHDQRH